MKRYSATFMALTLSLASLVACDLQVEKEKGSGKDEAAKRKTMDVEAQESGSGFSLVQPDLPPSEEDIAAYGQSQSLSLSDTANDQGNGNSSSPVAQGTSVPGNPGFIGPGFPAVPAYYQMMVFKVTVLEGDKVIKEVAMPYLPRHHFQILGIPAGDYTVKVEILRQGQIIWQGDAQVTVTDDLVKAKVVLKRVKSPGIEVQVTTEDKEFKVCDYVPKQLPLLCALERFECSIEVPGQSAIKVTDYCAPAYAKKRLLQQLCDKDIQVDQSAVHNIQCKRISLIARPDVSN